MQNSQKTGQPRGKRKVYQEAQETNLESTNFSSVVDSLLSNLIYF